MAETMTFERWLAKVDYHITRIVGLTHRDIADWTWYDAWADGVSSLEAAQTALINEMEG